MKKRNVEKKTKSDEKGIDRHHSGQRARIGRRAIRETETEMNATKMMTEIADGEERTEMAEKVEANEGTEIPETPETKREVEAREEAEMIEMTGGMMTEVSKEAKVGEEVEMTMTKESARNLETDPANVAIATRSEGEAEVEVEARQGEAGRGRDRKEVVSVMISSRGDLR